MLLYQLLINVLCNFKDKISMYVILYLIRAIIKTSYFIHFNFQHYRLSEAAELQWLRSNIGWPGGGD